MLLLICYSLFANTMLFAAEKQTAFKQTAVVKPKDSKLPGALRKSLPLALAQSIDLAVNLEDITSRYKISMFKQFTFIFFHQTRGLKEEDDVYHIIGGGIETPFLTAGNFYEHGLFRNFKDLSDTQAWNSVVYQYTRWSIRRDPVSSADLGALISLPAVPFTLRRSARKNAIMSAWVAAVPLDSEAGFTDMQVNVLGALQEQDKSNNSIIKPSTYHMGANLGYDFGFWEPRLLYKYSWRDALPLHTTNWSSWSLVEPTALRLQQVQLAQKFTLGKLLLAELIVLASTSDTIKNQYAAKALIRMHLNRVELGLQLALAESLSITDEWKYSKYLWNSSAELLYLYKKGSKLKFRVNFAEYNPAREEIDYPQSIRRTYLLQWSHLFEVATIKNKQLEIEPELEYDYIYTIDNELHRSAVEGNFYYHNWKHSLRTKIDWYIAEKSRALDKLDVSNSVYTHYEFQRVPFRLWSRFSMLHIRDMEKQYAEDDDIVNDVLEDIITELGIRIRKKGFRSSFSLKYNFTEDSSISDAKAFKHEYFVEMKVQYNW